MSVEETVVRIRGRNTLLPSVRACGCTIVSTGSLLKIGHIFDEELVEKRERPDIGGLIKELRAGPLALDVVTFGRAYTDMQLDLDCPSEMDNLAVASTTPFEKWWASLPQASRKNVRLAEKKGVVVRAVAFDDDLIRGIKEIYDESPVRQGRRFWHFGKSLDEVRLENSTYASRSQFIGAYVQGALIGFIKFIRVDNSAVLIQILAKESERDRKPMNALLSHAFSMCSEQGLTSIVYGKYRYGRTESSLLEFKRRNAFSEFAYPVYNLPLSPWGKFAVAAGLHRGLREALPAPVVATYVGTRAKILRALGRGR